mgnify:FL=1
MKKKRKKCYTKDMKYDNDYISREQIVEIYTEAYYRALKRIEKEKIVNEIKEEKRMYKWYEKILLMLNVIICPWKLNKRFSISTQICDNILVLFTSMVMSFIGSVMWFSGLGSGANIIYKIILLKKMKGILSNISIMAVLLVLGSAFILAGKAFERETESNKIYAYSASIFALISCIITIITMIVGLFK